jgi:hypothetical protein
MDFDPKIEEYGSFKGDDILAYTGTKDPIIDSIFYEKDVLCISSFPGVGKSILALQLLSNLTTGEPFLGIYEIPKAKNVLYVQTEGDRAETIQRLSNMKSAINIDYTKWAHMNLASIAINTTKGLAHFISEIHSLKMQFDIIILDPLYTTVMGSMSDDDVTTDWIRNIREIRRIFGTSFILLHHDAKDIYHEGKTIDRGNKNLFGSTFWSGFINVNYKFKLSGSEHHRVLELGKERKGNLIDNIKIKLIEPCPLFFMPSEHSKDSTIKVEVFIRGSKKWVHLKDMVQNTGLARVSVYRALKELLPLLDKKQENGVVYYKYKDTK